MYLVPAFASSSGRDEVVVGNNGSGNAELYLYSNGMKLDNARDQFGNTILFDSVFGIVTAPFASVGQTLFCGSVAQQNEGAVGVAFGGPSLNPNAPFPGG
jgi:hypothetical protein